MNMTEILKRKQDLVEARKEEMAAIILEAAKKLHYGDIVKTDDDEYEIVNISYKDKEVEVTVNRTQDKNRQYYLKKAILHIAGFEEYAKKYNDIEYSVSQLEKDIEDTKDEIKRQVGQMLKSLTLLEEVTYDNNPADVIEIGLRTNERAVTLNVNIGREANGGLYDEYKAKRLYEAEVLGITRKELVEA